VRARKGHPVGEQMRRAREAAGLTLREVAIGSGSTVSAPGLCMVEKGHRYPSLRTLEAVARVLDVDIVVGPGGVAVRRREEP
jgi:transcriptional regulator with XRE-family HTH domain